MNPKAQSIIEIIKSKYGYVDTILVFGSAITTDWTEQSDVDVFLVDNSFHDSRSETIIDGVTVEFQENNFENIKNNMEAERGNLLHRNLSTMIATSKTVFTKSPTKLTELKTLADDILASTSKYDETDVELWRYSILDYLAKAEKDIARNDAVAFSIDAHYVLQNALELSLATHGTYMPQPKNLAKLLTKKDPELLKIWQNYLSASDLKSKLSALSKLNTR